MAIGPLSAPAGSVGRVGSNDHLSPQSVDQVDSGPSILTNKFPHPPVSLFFNLSRHPLVGFGVPILILNSDPELISF